MSKIHGLILFFAIWLIMTSGSFAQNDEVPPPDPTDTANGQKASTATRQPAYVETSLLSASQENRGDPLVLLLYYGTINGDVVESGESFFRERLLEREGRYLMFVQAEEDAPVKEDDEFPADETPETISDPLEPINRVFFHFNDKLYFWLLKPVATGYSVLAPEPMRISIKNFYYNLLFPVRFVNCLLQGKPQGAGEEMRRFTINTIVGLGGFFDVATEAGIKNYDEDLGQTLGAYGLGPAFYINWPFLGPSSFRDTFGFVGDAFLTPLSIILSEKEYALAYQAFGYMNQTSLRLGDYEALKKAAFDPYLALRDAYYQNRQSKIKE